MTWEFLVLNHKDFEAIFVGLWLMWPIFVTWYCFHAIWIVWNLLFFIEIVGFEGDWDKFLLLYCITTTPTSQQTRSKRFWGSPRSQSPSKPTMTFDSFILHSLPYYDCSPKGELIIYLYPQIWWFTLWGNINFTNTKVCAPEM